MANGRSGLASASAMAVLLTLPCASHAKPVKEQKVPNPVATAHAAAPAVVQQAAAPTATPPAAPITPVKVKDTAHPRKAPARAAPVRATPVRATPEAPRAVPTARRATPARAQRVARPSRAAATTRPERPGVRASGAPRPAAAESSPARATPRPQRKPRNRPRPDQRPRVATTPRRIGAATRLRRPTAKRAAGPSFVTRAAEAAVTVVPRWLLGLVALLAGATLLQPIVARRRRARERSTARATTVSALAGAVAARDGCTGRHIERVSDLGLLLARSMAPKEANDPQLAWGFLLHDVGKLAVPDAVLQKPGRLDAEERAIMCRHPEIGAEMLADLRFLDRALDVVRHHHERWDGGGYPDGLAGEAIPLWARMFAVVDAVDAMTSDRPYRKRCTLEEACDVLRKEAGRQFDPACVRAFLGLDAAAVGALLEDGEPAPLAIAA